MVTGAGLWAQKNVSRWLWEGAKVIAAASISAIFAMQITIAVIKEQLNGIRKDVDRMRIEGDRLHDEAKRDRDALLGEVRSVKDAIHNHEVDSLRRQIGSQNDYGVPQP